MRQFHGGRLELCMYIQYGRYSHKRMWEAHFRAVDNSISDTFEECEKGVVARVEDDALKRSLEMISLVIL